MARGLWVGLMRLDFIGGVGHFLFACGLGLVGLASSFDSPHMFAAHALEESRLPFVRSSHLTTQLPPTEPDSSIHIKCPFNQSGSARNEMEQEGARG